MISPQARFKQILWGSRCGKTEGTQTDDDGGGGGGMEVGVLVGGRRRKVVRVERDRGRLRVGGEGGNSL